ncbi:MAG: glucose-6-phosphate dehydrogenase [Bacteroidales bacterium]|nr:glucose-6-phosphate dehydrogenase [Bacteroidales bacterium]
MKEHLIIIFGGSGDLASRKLIPALYSLHQRKKELVPFKIVAVGRTSFSNDSFREHIIEKGEYSNKEFFNSLFYLQMDPSVKGDYSKLIEKLKEFESSDYLFYLATPPSLYESIPTNLKLCGLNKEEGESSKIKPGVRKIIVEKPFGYDLESAIKMNSTLRGSFNENQIFRIDHYLGKETVQNILALRFANTIFEPIWNRNYIERVEITAVENMGIGSRGSFYDGVGALRDMVQNHLIQLLALVAMEPPVTYGEKEFRDEVVKVYSSLKPLTKEEIPSRVVRGQYIAGEKKGEMALAYRQEKGVKSNSQTETFLAMQVKIANWRWEGVPFYIRTGKQMPTKVTEIVIHFRDTPHRLFSSREECPDHNQLIIRIQPNEGMVLKFDMKIPGSGFDINQVPMDFTYDKLGEVNSADGYSRLLEEALKGDNTLFTRSDAVEASWRYFSPVLQYFKEESQLPLHGYPAGSWGPLESEAIITNGHRWSNPCKNLTNTDIYCEL